MSRVLMINKVATTHCLFFRLQIKREDIIDKCRECDKDRRPQFYKYFCGLKFYVSNTLTYHCAKLSDMEIFVATVVVALFIIENLKCRSIGEFRM
jgi:hypothetical protein